MIRSSIAVAAMTACVTVVASDASAIGTWDFWLDKVVITLLLLIVGLLSNVVLEGKKSKLALKSEMAKRRVEYVGTAWSEFNQLEALGRTFIGRLLEAIKLPDEAERTYALTDLASFGGEAEELSTQARELIEQHRFWLGEPLYERFVVFHDLLVQRLSRFLALLHDPANEDLHSACERVEKQITDTRRSISHELRGQGF